MTNLLLTPVPLNELALIMRQEFETAYRKILKETPTAPAVPLKEFFTEPESREFLGGISRSLFHKLKKEEKFNTYHCGEGRCLYSREELILYIKTNKPSAKQQ
ncbi:hypothetical protein ACFSKU_19150 [Pontibacter silvestris]|uniref:DNA-binding protein n=1 Tax=Pontibacter silvestris TaxID=2305183 RepID=A0ABW4X2Z2_9BACT|nr:hypothetical protein [Pontibacter silvestris]MCC9134991.1 hypothetical protein [Pontibacter silvestris]